MRAVSKSSDTGGAHIIGRILGSLFLSVFLAAGLFFTYVMGGEVVTALSPWFWTKVECTILESHVQQGAGDDAGRWFAEISYRFRDPQTGRARTSSQVMARVTGADRGFEDASEAYRRVQRFPADTRTVCYVQSGGEGESVLIRKGPWIALVMLFPLVFVAVGGGGIAAIWWRRSPKPKAKALSQQPSFAHAHLLVRGFFGLFFLVGAAVGYGFFVKPAWKILQAKSWPEVPCTIVQSGVKTNHDSDGDTHRVDIQYRYEIAGESFDANRYSFFGGSSSGYAGKQATADRYRAGSRVMCFVNPRDPTDAVLERGFVGELWFGLIPGVFCLVGLLGLIYVRPASPPTSSGLPVVPARTAVPEAGTVTLKSQSSPLAKFLFVFFFAAIWNGVVSLMFIKGHEIPWWFKGLFGLAGLGILSGAFHQFLALFNPRPVLTVNRQSLPLGGELQLDWSFRGNPRRISRLRIFLRGREEATYRRGTDTTTDKHTFTEIELLNETDPAAFAFGQASAIVPVDSMHTFVAPNNKVLWSLHFEGKIPKWPDVEEEFAITVLPRAVTS